MMSMASALTNHWVVSGSSRHDMSNRSDDCFKVLTWNHNVIKGKQFLPREKVALTGWQITRAVPKDPKKGIHLRMTTKWWEIDMKDNVINIKSQDDFDEQLLMARDKFTVVHFFSPSCGACKALHSKVHQFAEMHPGLQFLMVNCNEQTHICKRLHVCVLPLFRFYRGAEGRICSFSCTISTIHKFKDALKKHGVQTESQAAEKGWDEY
ncbi:thioredoxin-like 1-1, chloroplastic isoform X1 [Sorghum bicolor]|uniref:thioredoxin-like 1-1, chloroplastic isoform X1 n=1 Tax=Sorghum bicolor TaxID=4558 RepID=UPI000B4262CB|nr:thioredoxin-like 1-1, chloroplastic isoform X1 [Sorghum bicolor]|eukprot:XP_002465798.2 thioredoxin-like 1-1, chloroplastic isoform X1 [Sorghum bicolor]